MCMLWVMCYVSVRAAFTGHFRCVGFQYCCTLSVVFVSLTPSLSRSLSFYLHARERVCVCVCVAAGAEAYAEAEAEAHVQDISCEDGDREGGEGRSYR